MAVGIDDVAAAASSEVSEVASSSTSVEILGDGLGEDSLGESLDDSIEMPFDSSEQQGIEGDGIGEDTSDAAESEQIIDVNGETEISGLDSINESIDNGITDVTPQIETNDDNLETDSDDSEGGIRKIKTINDGLVGQNHPDTGVPYVEKTVETDTGEKVKGVFPQFDSVADVQLPEDLQQASDKAQFAECNRQLKEMIASDPELRSKFTEDQLADIEDGYTPEGYTWHHNEEKGKMQLVDSDVHGQTRHTGGRNIWGGGTESRH